jgi:hypothetical protein
VLLVDAHNVLGVQGVLPMHLAGIDLPGLGRLLARSRYAARRVRLVADGRPDPRSARAAVVVEGSRGLWWGRLGRVEVVFAGAGFEADDVIEEALRRPVAGAATGVVSSDRRLVRAAGRAGAESIRSETFLKHLASDRDRPAAAAEPAFVADVPLDRYSIAHWMAEFGVDLGPAGVDGLPARAHVAPASPRARPPEPKRADRTPPERPARVPAPVPADEPLDPLLAEAFEEWRGRLSPADLQMCRWVPDAVPLRAPDRPR